MEHPYSQSPSVYYTGSTRSRDFLHHMQGCGPLPIERNVPCRVFSCRPILRYNSLALNRLAEPWGLAITSAGDGIRGPVSSREHATFGKCALCVSPHTRRRTVLRHQKTQRTNSDSVHTQRHEYFSELRSWAAYVLGHIFSVYSVVLLFSRGILGICI